MRLQKRTLVKDPKLNRTGKILNMVNLGDGKAPTHARVKWHGVAVQGRFFRRSVVPLDALVKIKKTELGELTKGYVPAPKRSRRSTTGTARGRTRFARFFG